MNSTPGPKSTGSTPIQPGTFIGQNSQAGSRAATSTVQGDDRPSNSTEQMNRKREEKMIALKGFKATSRGDNVLIKALADILQSELNSGSGAGDVTQTLNVEEISIIATIAVRSDKDGKGKCLLKLTCGKDDPHVRKPSVEKLSESQKKSKKPPESHKKSKVAMIPSENWSMVDVLDDIKNVMAK